jgi:hypothetical protein
MCVRTSDTTHTLKILHERLSGMQIGQEWRRNRMTDKFRMFCECEDCLTQVVTKLDSFEGGAQELPFQTINKG